MRVTSNYDTGPDGKPLVIAVTGNICIACKMEEWSEKHPTELDPSQD